MLSRCCLTFQNPFPAQVRKLQGQQAAIAGEARTLIAKSRAKEAANAKLWEQVRAQQHLLGVGKKGSSTQAAADVEPRCGSITKLQSTPMPCLHSRIL